MRRAEPHAFVFLVKEEPVLSGWLTERRGEPTGGMMKRESCLLLEILLLLLESALDRLQFLLAPMMLYQSLGHVRRDCRKSPRTHCQDY